MIGMYLRATENITMRPNKRGEIYIHLDVVEAKISPRLAGSGLGPQVHLE